MGLLQVWSGAQQVSLLRLWVGVQQVRLLRVRIEVQQVSLLRVRVSDQCHDGRDCVVADGESDALESRELLAVRGTLRWLVE